MRTPVWIRLAADRRNSDRLRIPPCPRCGDINVTVRTRTEFGLFIICATGHAWSMQKPRFTQLFGVSSEQAS